MTRRALILAGAVLAAEHPERGIMFWENSGRYDFRPFAFPIAADNQWNVMAPADLNRDGRLDVVVRAMDLESIATLQGRFPRQTRGEPKAVLLIFENGMGALPTQ